MCTQQRFSTIKEHKKNCCAAPRLSDEEPDLMEQEDVEGISGQTVGGWLPWTHEDMIDIRRVIDEKMSEKQREVIETALMGGNAADLGVTEKYWRYHYKRAIDLIKKEMGYEAL
jgi:hypothetical protein